MKLILVLKRQYHYYSTTIDDIKDSIQKDVLEFTIDTISHILKVKRMRPMTEKNWDLIKKESDNHDLASYKTHLEHLIEIGRNKIKWEGKGKSIHVINAKISDNKTKITR